MKYIDGFRQPRAAEAIRRQIAALSDSLRPAGRTVSIMEVCGTHTMAIGRYGIRDLLPENVRLLSGPGCPVCVTEAGYIDAAIALARRGVILATFGDMMAVPGSESTLSVCRSDGCRIEVCYSPASALKLALANPEEEVVFLAVGFETTIAPVVSLVGAAQRQGVGNLALLTAFKRIPPALAALLADDDVCIDAFLCPAHVSAIIGAAVYEPFSGSDGVPCVIAGFEPLDILLGIRGILEQVSQGVSRVENQYNRVVRQDGNAKAQAQIDKYLEPVDTPWRGLGVIPDSGYALRPSYADYDAEKKHNLPITEGKTHPACRCGDVIKGKHPPTDCPLFAETCTPDHAVGPCMVSAEGTCSAYYKYSRLA